MKACQPAILFQDGCVLQQGKPAIIWGSGRDGETVTAECGGNRASCRVSDGKWECVLPAMEAGTGMTLKIRCAGEEQVLRNVSAGEVWIAGGQSNMAYALRYDRDWEETRNLPRNPDIHMFNVPRLAYPGHKKDTSDSGFWFGEGDAAWEHFSAPAYSFARHIQPRLGVPVGIIGCNWGGASASTWAAPEYMREEPLNVYLKEYEAAVAGKDPEELKKREELSYLAEETPEHKAIMDEILYGLPLSRQGEWQKRFAASLPPSPMGPYSVGRPGGLYHMMLQRIAPFSARGFLWYHGESDAAHAAIYDRLFAAVIRCFRDAFRQELPFLFVQLAPYGRWLGGSGREFPQLRRCQEKVSQTVPGAYMTSIMDLGMYGDLHPKQKMEVGRRLALLAMGKIYGMDVLCECPSLLKAEQTAEGLMLSFANAGDGLWMALETEEEEEEAGQPSELTGPPEMKDGFVLECDGERQRIHSVKAQGNTVMLYTDTLLAGECRISFAQVPYLKVRIFNSAGLPVKPFECRIV